MITAILLASGYSRRLHTDKLLLDLDGRPVIDYIMAAIESCPFAQKLLVQRSERYTELGLQHGFRSLTNPSAALGQSSSVRIGAENCRTDSAFMFFVGDQPYLTTDIIARLLHVHAEYPDDIIVPTNRQRYQNPVIFPVAFRRQLLTIEGDQGGRTIIKSHPERVRTVPFDDELAFQDIDTTEDYQFLLKAFKNR